MRYSGDVTLPDGRQFYVIAKFRNGDIADDGLEIWDQNENLLDTDAHNSEVAWPNSYDGKIYLWEACVELVCQQPPNEPDDDWL